MINKGSFHKCRYAYPGVGDEEQLVSGELETREDLRLAGAGLVVVVGVEGFLDTTVVGNVLTQSQSAVDLLFMKDPKY